MGIPPSHWSYTRVPHVAILLAVLTPLATIASADYTQSIASHGVSISFGHRLPVNTSRCSTSLASTPDALSSLHTHLDARPAPDVTLRLINAGLGTTATHAIHQALCRSGISSVHWDDHCHLEGDALQRHRDVIAVYEQVKSCANRTLERMDPRCSVRRVRHQLRKALVAFASSGVAAASDSPYTDLIPELLAMKPGMKVVQTLRDAGDWADQRLRDHGEDTQCKTGIGSFTLLECVDDHEWLGDALVTQRELLPGFGGDASQQLSASFAIHNQRIAGMVPSEQLWQMCAWDDSFADALADLAVSLDAPVRLPPAWLAATPQVFMSSTEPKRLMHLQLSNKPAAGLQHLRQWK